MSPAPTRQFVVSPSSAAACGVSGPRSDPTGLARFRQAGPLRAGRRGRRSRGSRAASPASSWRQIRPLAGQRALRARQRAGRAARSGSRRGRRSAPARFQVSGRCRFSHISFGVCHFRRHDAAEIVRARGGRSPCIRRPRRARGGRARRSCPSDPRRSPKRSAGAPSMSRTTSEQVASKPIPAMLVGRHAGLDQRAAHGAADGPPDVFANHVRHGRPSAGSSGSDVRRGRAWLPVRSTMPARALPVPTSTAQTYRSIRRRRRSAQIGHRPATKSRRAAPHGLVSGYSRRRNPPARCASSAYADADTGLPLAPFEALYRGGSIISSRPSNGIREARTAHVNPCG